jgi:hypothetical protein
MGTLNAADVACYEDHWITCGRCAAIVEETDTYVHAIQDAARRLRESTGKAKAAGQVRT